MKPNLKSAKFRESLNGEAILENYCWIVLWGLLELGRARSQLEN